MALVAPGSVGRSVSVVYAARTKPTASGIPIRDMFSVRKSIDRSIDLNNQIDRCLAVVITSGKGMLFEERSVNDEDIV